MKDFLLAFLVSASFAVFADEPQPTRVNLTSTPSGATVIIDGMDRGTTPIMVYDLTPGRHHVKIRHAGYYDTDRFINTNEGPVIEKNTVMREMDGLLLVKSEPSGADIQVNGVSVGQTPKLVTNLPVSEEHRIRLRKAGYLDQNISVKFEGRRPLVRDEVLVPASGTINLMSEPVGAEVTVNGIMRGKTPLKVGEIPKGRAVVKFHLDGFADEVRELVVSAGDEQMLPVVLKGLPGTIRITSDPEGARVFVNERMEGKSPLTLTEMSPAIYVIRVEHEGFGSLSRTIKLDSDSSACEDFRLSSVMGRMEISTSPAGVQVTIDGRLAGTTKAKSASADFSETLVIDNVLEGEHRVVLKKDGYADAIRHSKVENKKTTFHKIRLRRIFTPDVEIVTTRGTYTGVLVSNTPDSVVVEVSLGINRTFPRDEIKKVNFLTR
jgi:hypothetical protein